MEEIKKGRYPMTTQKKKDFLINCAYWAIILAGVYLVLEYLVPISVPFLLGVLMAWPVVAITKKLNCPNKIIRILLAVLLYGLLGLVVTLLIAKGISGITAVIKWLPRLYEMKLQPFVLQCYNWGLETLERLDPNLTTALSSLLESLLSTMKNIVTKLSGFAVNLVSGVATGVPSLVLSLLAMIFSTLFLVSDYDRISSFVSTHTPVSVKHILKQIRIYLTDTLFVVIRSYLLIMLLTFTELSILFSIFGIESPVLKAGLIAILDIMPILGTGGIMIPWAVISLVLGYTKLGIELFVIYGIVTVVRNYVEPKIVGAQLGLHPIITLVAMFIGLRIFGFWGLFGLPVGISFLWKQRMEKREAPAEN
jgi:sporulation integral membrane protein YtvI